jgi:hypothetical protein
LLFTSWTFKVWFGKINKAIFYLYSYHNLKNNTLFDSIFNYLRTRTPSNHNYKTRRTPQWWVFVL